MKKILTLFAVLGLFAFSSCSNDDNGDGNNISQVFELQNINFSYNANDGYNIYKKFDRLLYDDDVVLIYRLSGTIDANTPIWQLIPRTIYPSGTRELDYDFDFSREDFTIYAGGNYDLALTPAYLNNQTFRIVVVPGSPDGVAKSAQPDYSDYYKVIQKYNIDDSNVKKLN